MLLRELNVFATTAKSMDEAAAAVLTEIDDDSVVDQSRLAPPDFSAVESITMHGNAIATLANSLMTPRLTYLNLSSNEITVLDGALLANFPRLSILDLSCNNITTVQRVNGLTALTYLKLAHNQLTTLTWLSGFHSPGHRLQKLDVSGNEIRDLTSSIQAVSGCYHLYDVRFMNGDVGGKQDDEMDSQAANPMCFLPGYAQEISASCPQLTMLDGLPIATSSRRSVSPPHGRRSTPTAGIHIRPAGESPGQVIGHSKGPPIITPTPSPDQNRLKDAHEGEMRELRLEVAYMKEQTERIAFASRLAAEQGRDEATAKDAEIAKLKKELLKCKGKLTEVVGAAQHAGKQLRDELKVANDTMKQLKEETERLHEQSTQDRDRWLTEGEELRRRLCEAMAALKACEDSKHTLATGWSNCEETLTETRQQLAASDARYVEQSNAMVRLHEELASAKEQLRALMESTQARRTQTEAAAQQDVTSLRAQLDVKSQECVSLSKQLSEVLKTGMDVRAIQESWTVKEKELQQQLSKADEEMQSLRNQLLQSRVTERQLQHDVDAAKAQAREQAQTIATLRDDANTSRQQYQRELNSLHHACDEMRAQLRTRESDLATVRAEVQSARAAEAAAQRELERERGNAHGREREHAAMLSSLREELASCRVELKSSVDSGVSLQSLQAEVRALQQDVLGKTLAVRELELDKADLLRQLKALKAERDTQVRRVGAAAEDEVRRAMSSAKAEVTRLEAHIQERKRTEDALRVDIAGLQAQCERLREEVKGKDNTIHRLDEDVRAARKAVSDAEHAQRQASEECMKSVRIAEELQRRVMEEMGKCAAMEKQTAAAAKEVKVKDVMLDDQNDTIKKLKQTIAVMQEEHSIAEEGLREAVNELQTESEGLTRQLDAAQAELAEVQSKLDAASNEITAMKDGKVQLEGQLQQLQHALSEAQANTAALSQELREMNEQLQHANTALETKSAELAEAVKVRDELAQKGLVMATLVDTLQSELKHMRQALAACEDEAARQKDAAAAKLKHMSDLFSRLQSEFAGGVGSSLQ